MPDQELSPEEQQTEPKRSARASARDREQAAAAANLNAQYVVATTTHGKLTTPAVEFFDGWLRLSAPIVNIDQGGGELTEVEELTIPSTAVRQVVREK